MLSINATLIAQMVNFWIAYLIVRYCLVVPVYRVIVANNKREAAARNAIDDEQGRLERYEQAIREVWSACRGYVAEQRPDVTVSRGEGVRAPEPHVKPDTLDARDWEDTLYAVFARRFSRKAKG